MTQNNNIADNLIHIMENIINVSKISPLSADKTVLLAASKSQSAEAIEEAIAAGIREFGENRVQEARDKWPALRQSYPDIRLHLIGPLQTNKVKHALSLFDVIQTVDRPELLEILSTEFKALNHKITQQFYIQVNTGKEPQKAGALPDDADNLITMAKKLGLPVTGLMCVPPADQPPAPHFALLREIATRNNLPKLSMGMSNDYEVAVRMGSTCVRIGTALFGERPH